MHEPSFEISDGEVSFWVEQGQSMCLKAVTSFGDPVELNGTKAGAIAEKLIEFAILIDE